MKLWCKRSLASSHVNIIAMAGTTSNVLKGASGGILYLANLSVPPADYVKRYIEAKINKLSTSIQFRLVSNYNTSTFVGWSANGYGVSNNNSANRTYPFTTGDKIMLKMWAVDSANATVSGGKNGAWYTGNNGIIMSQYSFNTFGSGWKFAVYLGGANDEVEVNLSGPFDNAVPADSILYPQS